MSEVPFEFAREFWHWARNRKCVLCRALSLFVYPAGRRSVSPEVADAAEAAGAGQRLTVIEGDRTE